MRITLNLASRPHIDLRPYFQRLRLWMLLLAMLAACLWLVSRNEEYKAAIARAEEGQLQQSTDRLHKEQQGFQVLMHQPQNAGVLEQSEFLNQLFQRKSFSWTAAMMDLENVLPAGVQVASIEPAVVPGGTVSIRLRVLGPRDKAVDLIRNLEHSRRFVSPRLAGESAENSNTNNNGPAMMQPISASSQVTFEILADYNPLVKEEKKEESKTKAETGTGKTEKGASTKPAKALPGPRPMPIQNIPSKHAPQGGSR